MSRPNSPSVGGTAIGVAAAIVAATIGYVGLLGLARPAGASDQMAAIVRHADEAERIKSRLKPQADYPRGAVCDGDGEAALSSMQQKISSLASQNGGLATEVTGTPVVADEAHGRLQAVILTIDSAGASASVMGFLQSLSTATPSVFVDKLDLRQAEGKVTLKLTGRLFCSRTHL